MHGHHHDDGNSSSTTGQLASNGFVGFLKQLETALGGNNSYGPSGTSGSSNTQAVLVNALA